MPEPSETLETASPPPPRPDRDPEFRTPRAPGDRGPDPLASIAGDHQRLVANPFLGMAVIFLGLFAVPRVFARLGTGPGSLVSAVLAGASCWFVPRLIHYHCRDCGATGRLSAWKEHACPAVRGRRLAGSRRLVRGPSPPTQVVIWIYLILALAVAWNAFGGPGRGPGGVAARAESASRQDPTCR